MLVSLVDVEQQHAGAVLLRAVVAHVVAAHDGGAAVLHADAVPFAVLLLLLRLPPLQQCEDS